MEPSDGHLTWILPSSSCVFTLGRATCTVVIFLCSITQITPRVQHRDMRRLCAFHLIFTCLCVTPHAVAEISEARALSVSRCFFVYAPMYEVSGRINDILLRSYATQRLMYVRGVLEASKTDPLFKQIFENNLPRNKAAGMSIEEKLVEARRTGNTDGYNKEISRAAVCDKELGL